MRTVAWVFAPFILVAWPAPAEIFKCAGKDGAVVYQNFRCEIDSLGSLPSAPTPAGAEAPKATAAAFARVERANTPTAPRVGMSADEVRAIWGEPHDSFNEEPGSGERSEVWVYGPDRSIRFDHRSRVIAVQVQGVS